MGDDRLPEDLHVRRAVQVTAHRAGAAAAPENTLAALRQAVADGAECAEIDVQESADGVVILLHDRDLLRVAGVACRPGELAWEELRRLDAGSWFSSRFAGEPVPSLAEVLRLARGRIRLNIELKCHDGGRRLGERVAELVEETRLTSDVIVTSESCSGLQGVRAVSPALRLGFVVADGDPDEACPELDILSMRLDAATPGRVRANRNRGLETHVWTVNDRDTMHLVMDRGVDSVITDRPLLAREVIAERAMLDDGELMRLAVARHARWRGGGPRH